MHLDVIKIVMQHEIAKTEELIKNILSEDLSLYGLATPAIVKEIGQHLTKSGGKKLRPLITLLAAMACDYRGDDHIKLAAVIELIHIATLLHDDVVDDSKQRRGKPTANIVWNNSSSILVGDFLISRAFNLVANLGDIEIIKILSRTTNTMATGEIQQLVLRHNPSINEDDYRQIIYAKTASLFQAAAQLGAQLSNASSESFEALSKYATHLGMAFQIVDDLLDYSDNSKQIGKNIGDDLAEGKATLPLIHAISNSSPEKRKMLEHAIINGSLDKLEAIKEAIISSGAIKHSIQVAHQEAELSIEALAPLKPSVYKDKLIELSKFAVIRAK